MAYLATQLITRAYYLSGIVARNFEQVSADQITDGLFLLNVLLDFKATDVRLIPYFTRYTLNLVQGQELYFIPNLYGIENATFNIGPVRFPMTSINRNQYFGSGRVDNIQSLPFQWHLERVKGGSNLYVYFLPLQNYVCNFSGKFALTDVTLNQDISLVYDNFYIEYLRYALAHLICNENDVTFAPEKMQQLKIYEKKLLDVSPPDLTMSKVVVFNNKNALNWGVANISRGWTI